MDKAHKRLKTYIEKAKNILIVSHRGPDMDAFCSMLLVKEFLNIYYPNKNVIAKAKQLPNFNIPRMHDITVVESLDEGEEDLIIIVDMGDIDIVCEKGDSLNQTSKDIVIIDHHQTLLDQGNLVINNQRSSASEQVIVSFKKILGKKFSLTEEIAQLGQYGINADTGRFLYDTTTPETLRLYADLYEFSPIDLEEVNYKLNKFPEGSIDILSELLKRVNIEGDMAYTYINRNDLENWSNSEINEAFMFFKNNIIRFIQGVHWGFMIKPSREEPNNWWLSFRSTKGYQEVDKIAEKLGGGGHMYASGAKLEYSENRSLEQVLTDVVTVIKDITTS